MNVSNICALQQHCVTKAIMTIQFMNGNIIFHRNVIKTFLTIQFIQYFTHCKF